MANGMLQANREAPFNRAVHAVKRKMASFANKGKKPELGTGERFAQLKSKLAAKGASNPGGLASYIGRKKLGKAKFQSLAAKGKPGY